jgi:UrcA family protein
MNAMKTVTSKAACLSAVAGVVMAMGIGAALAGDARADERLTATVSYAGLDLSTRAGAETLYRRIKAAAKEVCAPWEGHELERVAKWRSCYGQAVANAVAEVHRPALTALHQAGTAANPGG